MFGLHPLGAEYCHIFIINSLQKSMKEEENPSCIAAIT